MALVPAMRLEICPDDAARLQPAAGIHHPGRRPAV